MKFSKELGSFKFGRLLWGMGPDVVVRCHYVPKSHGVLLDLLSTRYFVITKTSPPCRLRSSLLEFGAALPVDADACLAVKLTVAFGSCCSPHLCIPIWISGRCTGDPI